MMNLFFFIRLTLFLLIIAFVVPFVAAQPPYKATITGKVLETTGKPARFLTVVLLRGTDSTLITRNVTDSTGSYQFNNVAAGLYKVGVASMGYQEVNSKAFTVAAITVTAPILIVGTDIKMLTEVLVKGQKPLIEIKADKTVFNVENSTVAAGGTALDVLERAPGVQVDAQNDRLTLQGREGVTVMLDGKPTYLSMQALMALLRSTPSNSVQSVELITNPSAKYDAAGNSGIINIKLKRGSGQIKGTNGSVTVGSGYGQLLKYNAGLTLNHQQSKWNLFGNYNYDYNPFFVHIDTRTRFRAGNETTTILNDQYRQGRPEGHTFKMGADYSFSKKDLVGVLINGTVNQMNMDAEVEAKRYDTENKLQLRQPMTSDLTNETQRLAVNLNYKHTLDSVAGAGKASLPELIAELDYANVEINQLTNIFLQSFNSQNGTSAPDEFQRNPTLAKVLIKSGKLDYTHPFNKSTRLETGLKSSYVSSDNDVVFEKRFDNAWQTDFGRTNHFIYDEMINAAYFNGNHEWKKWSLQGGLRLEHTFSVGNLVTLTKKVKRNYLDLFPSIFLMHKLHANHQLRYSYSRRIDRPSYFDLNPFVFIISPNAYYQGNEFLRPQYTHALQVAYTYKNQTTVGLSYNRTRDVISRVNEQENATLQNKATVVNLDKMNNINLNIGLPITITKWWNMRQSADIFWAQYNAVYLNQNLDVNRIAANFSMNHNFILPQGITAELSGFYNSPSVNGMSKQLRRGQVSVGAQKSLCDKKATLRVNLNDVFYTMRFGASNTFANTDNLFIGRFESRVLRVSFTYNFGNKNIKSARQRRVGSEEEQRRVGGGNN